MSDRPDAGLDLLLDLDGESFAADSEGKFTVRFVVKQVPPSSQRPHGLSYSLTLHDVTGTRLVGFDNAHATRARKGRRRRVAQGSQASFANDQVLRISRRCHVAL